MALVNLRPLPRWLQMPGPIDQSTSVPEVLWNNQRFNLRHSSRPASCSNTTIQRVLISKKQTRNSSVGSVGLSHPLHPDIDAVTGAPAPRGLVHRLFSPRHVSIRPDLTSPILLLHYNQQPSNPPRSHRRPHGRLEYSGGHGTHGLHGGKCATSARRSALRTDGCVSQGYV